MKIFFCTSVAALLGFVTVASPLSAQDSPLKLWESPRVANSMKQVSEGTSVDYPPYPQQTVGGHVQSNGAACAPGSGCNNGPASVLGTPYETSSTPFQQGTPVYNGGAVYNGAHQGPLPDVPCAPTQSGVPYFYGGDNVSSPAISAPVQYGTPQYIAPNAYGRAMRGSWGQGDVYTTTSKGRKCGLPGKRGSKGNRNNGCGPQPQWFGGVNGLAFWRDDAKETFLTFPNGDPRNRRLTSRSVDADPFAGAEVTIGRHLKNGLSMSASYWGLFADADTARYGNGGPQTYLTGLSQLNYNASDVETYYNNRNFHRVRVRNEFHNLEVNMLRRNCASPLFGCGPKNRIDMFAGARFFKFDEDFQFAGALDGANYGADINDMFYDIDVENNLYGFQFGGNANYSLGKKLAFTAGSKVGVFGNHIKQRQSIYGNAGYATINSGSYTGTEYNFSNSKEDVAFLGEIDLGLRYCLNNNLSANIGYRGIFVNGVAHSTDQIPYNYTNVPGIQQINSNGSLILHGIYMGATYNF